MKPSAKPGSRNVPFVIDVGGKSCLLFKVREKPTSHDLTVVIRHPPYGLVPDANGELKATELSQQYLSIHPSLESPEQINAITLRTRLKESGELIPAMSHYTAAIKQHSNYAPIFTQRCSNLDHGRFVYTPDGKTRLYTLGGYDPSLFQLLYMILVSSTEVPEIEGDESTNSLQVEFTAFRLTLLWSYLSLPSSNDGMCLLLGTLRPTDLEGLEGMEDGLQRLMRKLPVGFPPKTCVPQFAGLRAVFKDQLMAKKWERLRTVQPPPSSEDLHRFVKAPALAGEFFKEGMPGGARYQQHMRLTEAKLLEDPAFRDDPSFQAAKRG